MKKKILVIGSIVLILIVTSLIYGCANNWSVSGNAEKIQAGSPNNAPVDVIGVGIEKKF